MKKRKDKKGNLLRSGEYQKKNGTYEYRYTDCRNRKISFYAPTLAELRQRKEAIKKQECYGISYAEGDITVLELIDRYIKVKTGLRKSTVENYSRVRNVVKNHEFSHRKINTIRKSDVKIWLLYLRESGLKESTIKIYKNVLSGAFTMAVEEDVLYKNPFSFRFKDVFECSMEEKEPMTQEQIAKLLAFCREKPCRHRYADLVIILLDTGMRISEMCGLTKDDLNFEEGTINVNKQLLKNCINGETKYRIEKTKTRGSVRLIPMTDAVKVALKNILDDRRPKVEYIVDGYSGFVFLTRLDAPLSANTIEINFERLVKTYNSLHPDAPLPNITPHVFRHTFCTQMANSGMNIKALQYLMGHSDIKTTLNVYAHKDKDYALEQFDQYKAVLGGK